MAIFNSYVRLPEGTSILGHLQIWHSMQKPVFVPGSWAIFGEVSLESRGVGGPDMLRHPPTPKLVIAKEDEDGWRWTKMYGPGWFLSVWNALKKQSALTVLPHSQVTNQTKKRDLKLMPAAISNTIKHKCIKRHLPAVLMILTWGVLHEFRLGKTQGNAAHSAGLQIWFSGAESVNMREPLGLVGTKSGLVIIPNSKPEEHLQILKISNNI